MFISSVEIGPDAGMPVALVDLGDTLCDCTPALRARMAQRRTGERENDDLVDPLPPSLVEARRRQVMCAPGFWLELAPRPAGFELLKLLRTERFQVYVLTKGPTEAPQVWADKVAWCRAHLPGVPVIVADDKARVHGHVLVDDWLPYVERWQRAWPAGLAILPAQPWNAQAVATANRIRDDGCNRDTIVAALRRLRAVAAEGRAICACVDAAVHESTRVATSRIAAIESPLEQLGGTRKRPRKGGPSAPTA